MKFDRKNFLKLTGLAGIGAISIPSAGWGSNTSPNGKANVNLAQDTSF